MLDRFPLRLTLACSRFARLAARKAETAASSVTWRVASLLDQHGELCISEIAALERVAKPTASTVVQRMEKEGLVERRADPEDSRSTLVTLSAHGHSTLADWRARITPAVEQMLGTLDPEDRVALERATVILEQLVDAADPASPHLR